jgi:ketosteroid isomerase-like protein
MNKVLDADSIRIAAEEFDAAIEARDKERTLACFASDCEVHVLDATVKGHAGAARWFDWMFLHVSALRFEPVVVMVDGDTYFEEFICHGKLKKNGRHVESKQSEVLIYDADYKIKILRLYFDRLDFAESVTQNLIEKNVVKLVKDKSLKGLV